MGFEGFPPREHLWDLYYFCYLGFEGFPPREHLGLVLFLLFRFRGVSAKRTPGTCIIFACYLGSEGFPPREHLGLVLFLLFRFRGVSAERTLLTLVIFSMLEKMAKCLARGFRRENTSDTCNFFYVRKNGKVPGEGFPPREHLGLVLFLLFMLG